MGFLYPNFHISKGNKCLSNNKDLSINTFPGLTSDLSPWIEEIGDLDVSVFIGEVDGGAECIMVINCDVALLPHKALFSFRAEGAPKK